MISQPHPQAQPLCPVGRRQAVPRPLRRCDPTRCWCWGTYASVTPRSWTGEGVGYGVRVRVRVRARARVSARRPMRPLHLARGQVRVRAWRKGAETGAWGWGKGRGQGKGRDRMRDSSPTSLPSRRHPSCPHQRALPPTPHQCPHATLNFPPHSCLLDGRHVGAMARCLQDPHTTVRRHALVLLTQLVLQVRAG